MYLTLGSKEHMEDPIACITSTAEQIATFKDSISGAVEDLEASTLRLPVTGGAKVCFVLTENRK
jgi:hypothetical protein